MVSRVPRTIPFLTLSISWLPPFDRGPFSAVWRLGHPMPRDGRTYHPLASGTVYISACIQPLSRYL